MTGTTDSKKKGQIKNVCGIIMPISDTPNYRPKHWQEVAEILYEVIESTEYEGKIVSDSKVSNIIHNEIVQNIAENPLVICDVSSKNPNVMFELGLRLAFDKPTIVIKDDETNYNFDTSPIRHLEYPKDLRHSEIIRFKSELKDMIIATDKAFKEGKYITFLQSFTKYKPKLIEEEIGFKEYFEKKIDTILKEVKASNKYDSSKFQELRFKPINVQDIIERFTNDYVRNVSKEFWAKDESIQTNEIIQLFRLNYPYHDEVPDNIIAKIIDDHLLFERL